MKNVKLTNEERHQGIFSFQFADDVINSSVEDFMDKPVYKIQAINMGEPVFSFKGDNGDVMVSTNDVFELNMTDFFYKKVAIFKKNDVVSIEANYDGKWNYMIARVNTKDTPNTQKHITSNGVANIPDAPTRIKAAEKERKAIAKGQVKMHFTLKAFGMGLDINDENTRSKVEDNVDYVMGMVKFAEVTIEEPPPHTDADVPKDLDKEDLPF